MPTSVIVRSDNVHTASQIQDILQVHVPQLRPKPAARLAARILRQGQQTVWQGPWAEAELCRRHLAAAGLRTDPIPVDLPPSDQEKLLAEAATRWASQSPRFRLPRRFRFTLVGKIFTGMTVLVSIAAFNTGNNPLYLLFGMMLSLIVISGVLSERVLRDIEVRRHLPAHLFANQSALVGLTLTNRKRRATSFSLRVSERIRGLSREQQPSVYVLRVDPQGQASASYHFAFPHRGVWQLQGFEISTSFPFELFCKGLEIDRPVEVVVYPQPAPPPPLPFLVLSADGQQRSRPQQGQDGEFFALREYRPGDDARNIHWKLSAKRDRLITRDLERRDAQSLTLCLPNLWDPAGQEEVAYRRQLERTVEVCAGLAQHLIAQHHAVALVTLEGRTPFGDSPQHLHQILTALARLPFHGDPLLPQGATPPHLPLHPQDQCILIAPAGRPTPNLGGAQLAARIPVVGPG